MLPRPNYSLYFTVFLGTTLLNVVGLAQDFNQIYNLPPGQLPSRLAPRTQVNLFDGGVIPADYFIGTNIDGSEINIMGGSVGTNFRSSSGDVQINVSGGTIGGRFRMNSGNSMNVSGGMFEGELLAWGGNLAISDGMISRLNVNGQVNLNISGGNIGHGLGIVGGAEAEISGGTMGDGIQWNENNPIDLIGSEFRLDGELIGGLQTAGQRRQINVPEGSLFTGILQDGTPFAFTSDDNFNDRIDPGVLTLVAATLPAIVPGEINASTDPIPLGVREGQTLRVHSGAIVPQNLNAGLGSRVVIEAGGAVAENMEAVGAEVIVAGGDLGYRSDAFPGTKVQVSGGQVGAEFEAFAGSEVEISGGAFHSFYAEPGSLIKMMGNEFAINGQSVSGLNQPGDSLVVQLGEMDQVSGVLEDGTPVEFIVRTSRDSVRLESLTLVATNLPEIGPSEIRVSDGAMITGVRRGQTLIVDGELPVKGKFTAGAGSAVVIEEGAEIYGDFVAAGDSIVVHGGMIGTGNLRVLGEQNSLRTGHSLEALGDADLAIHGGEFWMSVAKRSTGNTVISDGVFHGVVSLIGGDQAVVSGGVFEFGVGIGAQNGLISNGRFERSSAAGNDSKLVITGGEFEEFEARSTSEVVIQGGVFSSYADAVDTGQLHIRGGSFLSVGARQDGEVTIAGGTISALFGQHQGEMTLIGREFFLDGDPLFSSLDVGVTQVLSSLAGKRLTGILADGSEFDFQFEESFSSELDKSYFADTATLSVTLVPEPSTWLMLFIGLCGLVAPWRFKFESVGCH